MAHPKGHTAAVLINLSSEDALRNVIGPTYDPHAVLNVIKMMAGTEDMYAASIGFIRALFETPGIDPVIREMIMLRAAKVLNCPYEWEANSVLARNVGLSFEEIEAAASDGPVSGVNADYVLVCKATGELSLEATLSDETLREMLTRFDDVVCRKLILVIGWFNLLARFLNGCRVPLENFGKLEAKTGPLS